MVCKGRFTKPVSRKKTDVLDCQWIQKPHVKIPGLSYSTALTLMSEVENEGFDEKDDNSL